MRLARSMLLTIPALTMLLIFAYAAGTPAHACTVVDPTCAVPAVVKPGEKLEILLEKPVNVTKVVIANGTLKYNLEIISLKGNKLVVRLPENVIPSLYDLIVYTAEGFCGQPNSVWVIGRDPTTIVIMHISDEEKGFLEDAKISEILNKYCKFLPIPIVYGKKKEWKDGKEVETNEDNQINDVAPAWTKTPADLKEEDYKNFYHQLYPMAEEPLFNIHLNVDYPFNLTGILYFPKIKNNFEIQKNKIQLYSNQVFVTDSVEGIVPEFLTMLHGVIDSPDIPLNVSRSYLQSDSNVKKISSHINVIIEKIKRK